MLRFAQALDTQLRAAIADPQHGRLRHDQRGDDRDRRERQRDGRAGAHALHVGKDLGNPGRRRLVGAGATVPITAYATDMLNLLASLPGAPPDFAAAAARVVRVTALGKIAIGLFLTVPAFLIPAWVEMRIAAGESPSTDPKLPCPKTNG